MKRATITDLMATASADTRRANPGLALPTRLDSRRNNDGAKRVSEPAETPKRATLENYGCWTCSCGYYHMSGVRVCNNCGTAKPAMPGVTYPRIVCRCPRCGRLDDTGLPEEVRTGVVHCGYCGNTFSVPAISPRNDDGAQPVSTPVRPPKRATGQKAAPFGRCQHTGRAYRSKTEARWAMEHPGHRYEALAIATPCGVYWPDFAARVTMPATDDPYSRRCNQTVETMYLYEIKGAFIRDRAMHKVKAAIRPARALGFAGIWLAQWDGKAWTVTEVQEG